MTNSTQPADRPASNEQDALDASIDKLARTDRIGTAAGLIACAGGAAAGASAAGTVAAAAGATTLLGSTSLAGALGGVFVAATPVGWVVGCAAVGALAAYGVSEIVRSGGRHDRIREEIVAKLSARLQRSRARDGSQVELTALKQKITDATQAGVLQSDQALRITQLLDRDAVSIAVISARIDALKA